MDLLYTDIFLLHYHAPKNYGLHVPFDIEAKGENTLCGDSLTLRLTFARDCVQAISFESEGCVISRAASSLLFEYIKGKNRKEIKEFSPYALFELLGITLTAARIKCVLFPLETIQKGV